MSAGAAIGERSTKNAFTISFLLHYSAVPGRSHNQSQAFAFT